VLAEHGRLLYLFYYGNPILATGSNPVLEVVLFPCTAIYETLSLALPFDWYFDFCYGTTKLMSAYVLMFLCLVAVSVGGYLSGRKQFFLSFLNSTLIPDIVLYTVQVLEVYW
jgi:hypothetical protein